MRLALKLRIYFDCIAVDNDDLIVRTCVISTSML